MIPVFDCHADTPILLWDEKQSLRRNRCHISLERADRLGHYAQFFAYCTYAGADRNGYTCEQLYTLPKTYMDAQLQAHADAIRFCTTAEQVKAAWARNLSAALYSIEGAEGIGCDAGRLEEAYRDGVRMTTLTWNADNALAGCHKGDRGLTAEGREFVRRAQALGIIVDVSHCSDRTFFDILDITQAPIVASHSDSRTIFQHSRNLSDEMYRLLCQTGGVAGINLYAGFLHPDGATFDDVYAHIDHFLQLCGDEHIALGGDLDGCDELPQGFSGVGNYAELAEFLLTKYSEETVEKIFYRNILQVLEQCQA